MKSHHRERHVGDRIGNASPLELANDIEHWLADEPVSVCPETRATPLSNLNASRQATTPAR